MNRRSRNGCVNCKKSKIKCDEQFPHCGTCQRRNYACQGYAEDADAISLSKSKPSNSGKADNTKDLKNKRRSIGVQVRRRASACSRDDEDSSSDSESKRSRRKSRGCSSSQTDASSSLIQAEKVLYTSLCPSMFSLTRGNVHQEDQPIIELYFLHHPSELVISSEFVDEMNTNVLQVFLQDPEGVCEILSAIGYVYLEEGQALVPLLGRKARILARLRVSTQLQLELMLLMLLGLCAIELIDGTAAPSDCDIPAIIANAALIIKHTENIGNPISTLAKYFIRAIARQDMMISLAQARRPHIPCSTWLMDYSEKQADRFMGFTMSLMPLLAELAELAHDIKTNGRASSSYSLSFGGNDESGNICLLSPGDNTAIIQRATKLRHKIDQWRPLSASNNSFISSRNMLFHAHAHKSAASLYLYRLLSPPGISEDADHIALSMAHEVLMHLSAMSDQLKTVLWPILVASSELKGDEDRKTGLHIFDEIHRQRRTITSLRAKNFCVERVWKARDDGLSWNWLNLASQYPGECLLI